MTRIGDTNQAHLTQQLLRNALASPGAANASQRAGSVDAQRADSASTRADRLPALLSRVSTLEQADVRFSTLKNSFDSINDSLRAARDAIASGASPADHLAGAQSTIDKTLASIDTLLSTESSSALSLLRDDASPFLTATDRDDSISRLRVRGEIPGGAESLDIEVGITASAQHAVLALSFGAFSLNLSAPSAQFQIEIAGALGSRTFTFASGATLNDVQDAFNSFRDVTGVSAATSGQNIRLDSRELGEDQFVSVRILNDGGQGGGVIRFSESDADQAASITPFNAAESSAGITDIGQDVAAIINGIPTQGDGLSIRLDTPSLNISFDVDVARAQTLGFFDAFTLAPQQSPLDTARARDALNALNAIDPANPTPESIDALTDAIGALSLSIDDLHERVVREPLAGLIAELRASSAPPPTQNTLDALRDAVSGTDPRDASALLKGSS